MGLRDREWFNEARKAPEKPKKAPRATRGMPKLQEPTWAVVIVIVCAAIAGIILL